jgi:hypothetical protein
MTIAFENSNKTVTWGELVNFLAEMHSSPKVEDAKKSANQHVIAEALAKLPTSPGRS